MNGEASSVSAEDGAWNGSPRQGAQRPGSAQGGQVEKTAMLDKSIDSAELKQVGIATGRARKVPHVGADVQDGCSLQVLDALLALSHNSRRSVMNKLSAFS
jgi:hypothetical protein